LGLRRGTVALELLLVLPIVLGVLLATVEFSMLLVAQQQLLVASREGARAAAQGGTLSDVQNAVQVFLGQGNLSQASLQATLTDATGQPLPSGSPVAVALSLPATQAVPDLLAFLGFSIRSETLTAATVMRKE
jgi:Flp pilus assembly protein TadG